MAEAEERHRRYGGPLNAYKLWLGSAARAQAEAADAAFRVGADLGPAQGLPISIKDVFGLRGTPTYCGTPRALPEKYEAEGPLVAGLRRQLAVFSGKSHTVPFAFGVVGTNRHWGTPRNPWDASAHRASGGSSSGAGVSLWEGSCVWALGSDSGGSCRSPAALTGCVGLRTSKGRWPAGGTPALSPTLDTPGLLARSVEDLIVGFAAIDPMVESLHAFLSKATERSLSALRVGVPENHFFDECGPDVAETVRRALQELETRGVTLVSLPFPEAADAAQWMANGGVNVPEGYALIHSEFPEWIETLDDSVWSRLSTYGAIDAQEYLKRMREIQPLRTRAHARIEHLDAIATPTTRLTAPRLDEVEELEAYRQRNMAIGRNLMLMNLWDFPSITLPVGKDPNGMPIGLQLSTRSGSDEALLAIAYAVERTLGTPRQLLGSPPLAA
ncbi:MAG: 2-amino-5-chloromuconate deaminase [Proteobacteria bacterium]|nr:MAG: 2-amino-5-chloromuconate deaminase [Pseudomonadota bacterium]